MISSLIKSWFVESRSLSDYETFISKLLRVIFAKGSWTPVSVINEKLITATELKNRQVKLYRLEVVPTAIYLSLNKSTPHDSPVRLTL
jgi:hypothetical protein